MELQDAFPTHSPIPRPISLTFFLGFDHPGMRPHRSVWIACLLHSSDLRLNTIVSARILSLLVLLGSYSGTPTWWYDPKHEGECPSRLAQQVSRAPEPVHSSVAEVHPFACGLLGGSQKRYPPRFSWPLKSQFLPSSFCSISHHLFIPRAANYSSGLHYLSSDIVSRPPSSAACLQPHPLRLWVREFVTSPGTGRTRAFPAERPMGIALCAEGPSISPAPCRTFGGPPPNRMACSPLLSLATSLPAPRSLPTLTRNSSSPPSLWLFFFFFEGKIWIRSPSHCHFPPSGILPAFQDQAHCRFFHSAFPHPCGQNRSLARSLSGLLLHFLLFLEDK